MIGENIIPQNYLKLLLHMTVNMMKSGKNTLKKVLNMNIILKIEW